MRSSQNWCRKSGKLRLLVASGSASSYGSDGRVLLSIQEEYYEGDYKDFGEDAPTLLRRIASQRRFLASQAVKYRRLTF